MARAELQHEARRKTGQELYMHPIRPVAK
jgi:hypothetical protein